MVTVGEGRATVTGKNVGLGVIGSWLSHILTMRLRIDYIIFPFEVS